MARRIWAIDGTRIGILCNDRENAESIARAAAGFYAERHQCVLEGVQRKADASAPLSVDEMGSFLEACDFLILALGDCEESARRLTDDALVCEQFGKPVLAVIMKPFRELADAITSREGILNYPFIAVDELVRDPGADEVSERGLLVYRQGLATLTGVYRINA